MIADITYMLKGKKEAKEMEIFLRDISFGVSKIFIAVLLLDITLKQSSE